MFHVCDPVDVNALIVLTCLRWFTELFAEVQYCYFVASQLLFFYTFVNPKNMFLAGCDRLMYLVFAV